MSSGILAADPLFDSAQNDSVSAVERWRLIKALHPNDPQHFLCTLYQTSAPGSHKFPLIAIGDYLQTESVFLLGNSMEDKTSTHPLSFAMVQTALQTGQEPFDGATVVTAINGEANIITAFICHADGSRPKRVCGRDVIKGLLRHIR